MVIIIKQPVGADFSILIEQRINSFLKRPRNTPLKLDKYIPAKRILFILDMGITNALTLVANSKTLHGYVLDKKLFIHPDSAIDYAASNFKKAIKQELKRKY